VQAEKPHWGRAQDLPSSWSGRYSDIALSEGAMPNDLWCADFKGEFKLGA
jgi:hypothetical protein